MAFESWDLDDHRLEEATRPRRPTRPAMVMPRAQAVHAEPGFPVRRPAFPQLERPPDQSWGINCAQTAIIPTNSTIDASAAASSTKVLNMSRSVDLEHRKNIVPFLFSKSTSENQRRIRKLNRWLNWFAAEPSP